jgi:hypothetical protein
MRIGLQTDAQEKKSDAQEIGPPWQTSGYTW